MMQRMGWYLQIAVCMVGGKITVNERGQYKETAGRDVTFVAKLLS